MKSQFKYLSLLFLCFACDNPSKSGSYTPEIKQERKVLTEEERVQEAISSVGDLTKYCPLVVSVQDDNKLEPSKIREDYVCEVEKYLLAVKESLEKGDLSIELQAKTLHQMRRDIGKKYKDKTPEWFLPLIYKRNEKKYKDPLGPTYEYLIESGKSNQDIIKSSITASGRNMLLDLPEALYFLDDIEKSVNKDLTEVEEATAISKKFIDKCSTSPDQNACVIEFKREIDNSHCLTEKRACTI